jgi:hypothetical protein
LLTWWRELPAIARCHVTTALIWLVGWSIALPIYCFATPEEADPLYDYKHSKSYLNGVEKFGGKAAVFGNDLTDGFASLWKGPTLGLTLGALTVVVAFGYYIVTRRRLSRAP